MKVTGKGLAIWKEVTKPMFEQSAVLPGGGAQELVERGGHGSKLVGLKSGGKGSGPSRGLLAATGKFCEGAGMAGMALDLES